MTNDNEPTETLTFLVGALAVGPADDDLAPREGDDAEAQAFWNREKKTEVEVSPNEIGDKLRALATQVDQTFPTASEGAGKMQLDSFKVGLAVTGSGKVVFVGELGVKASIEVVFKRSGSGS